jgi:hypothetical protein
VLLDYLNLDKKVLPVKKIIEPLNLDALEKKQAFRNSSSLTPKATNEYYPFCFAFRPTASPSPNPHLLNTLLQMVCSLMSINHGGFYIFMS